MQFEHLAIKVAVAGAALATGHAMAAGFALQNQNGAGTGNAFAGAAAAAEDASTVYFNPAGMLWLPRGHHLSGAVTLLDRSVEFSDRGTAPLVLPGPTVFEKGTNGGDGGSLAVVPAVYWAYSISPKLSVGLGVSPTFGNKTEFDKDFIGRFSGDFAEVKQININPSVAFRVSDTLAVGFGLNVAKNETEFQQAGPVPTGLSSPLPVFVARNVTIKGDDTAIGWNAGVLMQLTPATRVGLTYRSAMAFDLDGTQEIEGAVVFDVKAKLKTPDQFSLALHQVLDSKWDVLADLTWTGWSSVDTIRVRGGTHPQLPYHFKDTWRLGLGLGYQMNDAWKLRAGVAFDEAPVREAADRTMTLPDTDRTWLAIGARYSFSKQASLDVGYAHIFFKEGATARVVYSGSTPLQQIKGRFDVSADLLSVQYNHSF